MQVELWWARLARLVRFGPWAALVTIGKRLLHPWLDVGTIVVFELPLRRCPVAPGLEVRLLHAGDLPRVAAAFGRRPEALAGRLARGDRGYCAFSAEAGAEGEPLHMRWVTTRPTPIPEVGLWLRPPAGTIYVYDVETRAAARGRRLAALARAAMDDGLAAEGFHAKVAYIRGDNHAMWRSVTMRRARSAASAASATSVAAARRRASSAARAGRSPPFPRRPPVRRLLSSNMLDRRRFLGVAAASVPLLLAGRARAKPDKPTQDDPMLTKPVPKTGEALPVVGLGTYATFDVGPDQRGPLVDVMRRFVELGGRVIDSSPMYDQSEATVGDLLGRLGRPKVFLATKVWTTGKEKGVEQMARSAQLMGGAGGKIDLMQIHNLLDWKTHLPTLQAMKADGRIRYIGLTHYSTSAFGEMESILGTGAIDFIQVPYSLATREAEKRILPAAIDQKVAVLVMEPFERGSLFERAKGKPVPAFAAELGCASWAQVFLKFIIGHPAVTAPIPATSNVKHLEDNVAAGRGPLPTEGDRKKMVDLL